MNEKTGQEVDRASAEIDDLAKDFATAIKSVEGVKEVGDVIYIVSILHESNDEPLLAFGTTEAASDELRKIMLNETMKQIS